MGNMEATTTTTTTTTEQQQQLLNLTLMGTAEVVVLAPSSVSSSSVDENNKTIVVFIEDMTSREKKEMERRDLLESMKNVTAMIPVLQVHPKNRQPPPPPPPKEDDNNNDNEGMITNNNNDMDVVEDNVYEETRAYDRLVHGFSQSRIDTLLRRQQQPPPQSKNNEDHEKKDAVKNSSLSPSSNDLKTQQPTKQQHTTLLPHLLGKSVMTFGLELQRSYVNDVAVLSNTDGTLISGSDDGHIQLWKNCRRLCDVIHQPPGGSGSGSGNNSFKGVDSVIALDNNTNNEDDDDNNNDDDDSSIAFATAGRNCIRIWNNDAESILCVPSPLGYASPTGLVRVPITSHNNNNNNDQNQNNNNSNNNRNTVLCLASRYQIDRPQSRLSSRLVPQDEEGRRRHAAIGATEAVMNTNLTNLSKTIQVLIADTTAATTTTTTITSRDGSNSSSSESNNTTFSPPTVRSVFLTTTSPVTALVAWEEHTSDNRGSFLAAGDDQGGITIWKISMTVMSTSSSTSSNETGFTYQKFRHYQLVLPDNHLQTRSAIVCMSYIDETNQLIVSTREIAPTLPVPTPMDLTSSTVVVPITRPQAVHCLHINTSERNSIVHQPSSSPSSLATVSNDCLLFTLDGHKDIVQCILPLPNGDIITAGGKYDATLQIWSQSQLKEATTTSTATTHDNSNSNNNKMNKNSSETTTSDCPPTILRKAAIDNFCKEVGYVFAIECLKDFKNDKNSNNPTNTCNHFAIAVARYNVVKLII